MICVSISKNHKFISVFIEIFQSLLEIKRRFLDYFLFIPSKNRIPVIYSSHFLIFFSQEPSFFLQKTPKNWLSLYAWTPTSRIHINRNRLLKINDMVCDSDQLYQQYLAVWSVQKTKDLGLQKDAFEWKYSAENLRQTYFCCFHPP